MTSRPPSGAAVPAEPGGGGLATGGDEGSRTLNLLIANQALYQLSYVPTLDEGSG